MVKPTKYKAKVLGSDKEVSGYYFTDNNFHYLVVSVPDVKGVVNEGVSTSTEMYVIDPDTLEAENVWVDARVAKPPTLQDVNIIIRRERFRSYPSMSFETPITAVYLDEEGVWGHTEKRSLTKYPEGWYVRTGRDALTPVKEKVLLWSEIPPFPKTRRRKITEDGFYGKYSFLHPDYQTPVELDGITYQSASVAFASTKVDDVETKKFMATLTINGALALAKSFPKKENQGVQTPFEKELEEFKEDEDMIRVQFYKFSNKDLKQALMDTGKTYLLHATSKDSHWGTINGIGENRIGHILMGIRSGICDDEYIRELEGAK